MAVINLNHVNIRAPQPLLDRVRDFYVEVVGLKEGDRPNVGIAGYWLYAGDAAIVHLMDSAFRGLGDGDLAAETSYVDHFALTCTDVDATEEKLKSLGVDYRRNDAPQHGFSQLIMKDPAGVGVELNFPHSL